jgi:hypothetical protein
MRGHAKKYDATAELQGVQTESVTPSENQIPQLGPSKINPEERRELSVHLMRGHKKEYEAIVNLRRVQYESVIRSGESTLRASLLINGGAAVALLVLIGNLAARGTVFPIQPFVWPVMIFGAGLLATALAMGAGHLAGLLYLNKWKRLGNVFNWLAILFGISSLACFAGGCWRAAMLLPSLRW